MNRLRRRRQNDRSLLHHLYLRWFGHIGKLNLGCLDLRRLDLGDGRSGERLELGLNGRWFGLLDWNGVNERDELRAVVDGLLRSSAKDADDDSDDDIESDGGEERSFALAASSRTPKCVN